MILPRHTACAPFHKLQAAMFPIVFAFWPPMLPAYPPMPRADLGAGPSTSILADTGAVEGKIEEVEKDVRDIKERLSNLPEDSERRNVLEQQLAGLQTQLGALRQERLLLRQEGAMPLHACHPQLAMHSPPDLPGLMCTCMPHAPQFSTHAAH